MSRKKPDLVSVITILVLAAAFFALAIWSGKLPWFISAAHAQTVPPAQVTLPKTYTLQDRDTWTLAITEKHKVCWGDPNSPPADRVKIWRYRVEGGARTLYIDLPRSGWEPNGTTVGSFCKTGISVPKAGHWIYDAALCWGADNCSNVVTASCASGPDGCAGHVGGVPRGWWLYVFLPAPSGVGVN